MATPSCRTLPLKPLLLPLILVVAFAADEAQQLPITLPGCPDKCGGVSIPYPFGTQNGCFLPGFEVVCNTSFDPPRPFLAANNPISSGKSTRPFMRVDDLYYTDQPNQQSHVINGSVSPVELMDVLVAQGQARVHGAFSYDCRENNTYHSLRVQFVYFPEPATPFLLSRATNMLTVIGSQVEAGLVLDNNVVLNVRTTAECTGKGWCQAEIPPNTRGSMVKITRRSGGGGAGDESPCSYGMVVDKNWYNFSKQDLDGDSFRQRNAGRGVPVVLDFSVRGVACPAAGQPAPKLGDACASNNSKCVDGPIYPGHQCRCLDGFQGNPYIPNGCKDIDECERPDLYPCQGKCENTIGGYECTCPAGMRGDAKAQRCTDIFPLPAKVSLGALGGLFLMAILAFHMLLRREKRMMKDFFEKNGGPTLENAENLKIYKKDELKVILKPSNFVGKGAFGEVYKGLLDNQLVAVKKPIVSGNVAHNKQFANEVIIQSQVSHRNIVRLKGCCLEVDIPMLVYEFLPNGSLHDILHGNRRVPLNLDRRLSIAAESADALAYMHSKANRKILHGDVKPANILLDDNFVPKISDFGISRLIVMDKQHTNYVIGDMTYMDPVYLQTGVLTDKSDVYSFGVVLLELICRKKMATQINNKSFVSNFLEAHKKDKTATELFDKEIAIATDMDYLNRVVEIAVECLNLDLDQRPSMTEVADRLLIILKGSRAQII